MTKTPWETKLSALPIKKLLTLLESLTPTARKLAIRTRCRTDLPFFARHFFPELCRLPWSALHDWLFERRRVKTLDPLPGREGVMDVIIAPRGAAKSTLVSLVFPIHALLYRTEGYIVLISATLRQATVRLSNIKGVLHGNRALKEVFAEELGGVRRLSSRSIEVGDVRMDAFSAGTELRGISHGPWRPTWIILDDAERSDRTLHARHRDTLAEWFNEVIENLGDGYTHMDVIGTLLHRDALPARLMQRPDAIGREFASIMAEARREDLWQAWRERYHNLADAGRVRNARRFFNAHREAMLDGARVLWPEKEDYYALQVMRETRGRAAFDKEKQNAPWAEGSAIFNVDALRRFTLKEGELICDAPLGAADPAKASDGGDGRPIVPLDELRIHGFLDPALGGADGDFSAIATVGIDGVGYLYLLDIWLERATPSAQLAKVFDLHETWHYASFGVEVNAFQKLLLEPLETERTRRRNAGRSWDLPVVERRHRQDKISRIMALEPRLRNGWMLVSRDLPGELFSQLGDFPNGRHDDGPDAVAAATELAQQSRAQAVPMKSRPRNTQAAGNF